MYHISLVMEPPRSDQGLQPHFDLLHGSGYNDGNMWRFQWGIPNSWMAEKRPIRTDDLGVPPFMQTPISRFLAVGVPLFTIPPRCQVKVSRS